MQEEIAFQIWIGRASIFEGIRLKPRNFAWSHKSSRNVHGTRVCISIIPGYPVPPCEKKSNIFWNYWTNNFDVLLECPGMVLCIQSSGSTNLMIDLLAMVCSLHICIWSYAHTQACFRNRCWPGTRVSGYCWSHPSRVPGMSHMSELMCAAACMCVITHHAHATIIIMFLMQPICILNQLPMPFRRDRTGKGRFGRFGHKAKILAPEKI